MRADCLEACLADVSALRQLGLLHYRLYLLCLAGVRWELAIAVLGVIGVPMVVCHNGISPLANYDRLRERLADVTAGMLLQSSRSAGV